MSLDIDPKLCFVLMPMSDKFEKMYKHVIKPTVTELGLDCVYAGEIFGATPVMQDVWEYCATARVVIAEITGANPNVYYEAGYCHAFDSAKVIFITQVMDDVTFDVRHFRCIRYDPHPGDVDEFKRELKENIVAVLAKPPEGPRVVTHIVASTVEVPASIDNETREALLLHRILRRSAERGHRIVADERVAHLLKALEAATIVWPTIAPIKPGKHAVANVAVDGVLKVHAEPGQSHAIVGAISPYGRDVEVTGDGQEVDDEVWVPIRYEKITGWANGRYLARQVGWVSDEIAARALQMIVAIRREDMDTLATLVHPDKGVRFSPIAFVGGWDLVFGADQLRDAFAEETAYDWGTDDGGQRLDYTFRKYYDRFVYDKDFARPDVVYFNEHFQSGHTTNNIPEAYPDATTIEYQFEQEYHGFYWRALRLVLEEEGDTWYLVGIVHDRHGV
ncbi:MAG TPA: SH3 domain-containing protein [Anaerolineae bacterium]|nr:SH3 domain-containing protein [Anaerolineae bacterium]